MHDVSVLYHIVFAFDPHFACLAYSSFGAVADVVVILDYLGTDEALLEIRVDDTCTLRCLPSASEGPGLHLHLAGRDERLQGEQVVDGLDEAVAAALREPHVLLMASATACVKWLPVAADASSTLHT